MPVPTSYTEATLADYMHAVLGPVGVALNYMPATAYREPITETLLTYGTTDIATIAGAANLRKLRTLARVEVWRMVVGHVSGDFDFTADGATFSREQLHAMATANLKQAMADAEVYDEADAAFDSSYRVGKDRVTYPQDPYVYLPDENRKL